LNRWENHSISTWVNDVRQTEIHTAEPQVPKPSAFEVKVAIEKLKKIHITRY
jgi:hypothetical protein